MATSARILGTAVMLAGTLFLAGAPAQADFSMETVHVGNAGNAPDKRYYEAPNQDGGVAYEYDIGKYEVTSGQYREFLNAVAATDTYGLYNTRMDSNSKGCQITRNGISGNYTYDFSGGTAEAPGSTAVHWANRPVNYVSWGDAARFANWLHNGQPIGAQDLMTTEDGAYDLSATQQYYANGEGPQYGSPEWEALNAALTAVTREPDATWVIPTEDEWYKAAYHKNDGPTGNYFEYPTASDSKPSNDLVNPDPGNNATFYIYTGEDYTIGSPYWRTRVGEHENSESPYGTFDQGGNVDEWNEAMIKSDERGFRGSSFEGFAGDMYAPWCFATYPTLWWYDRGFRVALVPEPASAALLLMGGLALLVRNCRR